MDHKERYKRYLNSKEWASIKLDLIQTRGNKCERCGSIRKQFRYLHIHHLTYKNLFKEEPEDLEILCAACHRAEHGIVKKRKRDQTTQQKNKAIIESLKSKKGGYTAKALKSIGVKWPPRTGWKKQLINGPLIKVKKDQPKRENKNRKPKMKKRHIRPIDKKWEEMRSKFGFGNI